MDKFNGKYNIDEVVISTGNKIVVSGWILCDTDYDLRMVLGAGQKISINKKNVERIDVQRTMHTDEVNCGFKDEITVQGMDFEEVEIQILYKG